MDSIAFYDTTLRDGLRNSGVTLGLGDRVRLARALDEAGVDAIEVGFAGPSEVDTIVSLAESVERAAVFVLTRPHRRDRERALQALDGAGCPGVNIFSPCSDRFLGYMGWTRGDALRRVDSAIRDVRGSVSRVMFSVQDASGADPAFAAELVATAVGAGATLVSVSDTTSRALPAEFGALCAALAEVCARSAGVTLSVHCHNELGLAVANALAGIEHGARQVEVTVGGLGEGAGNTPLERMAAVLSARADAWPDLRVNLDAERTDGLGRLLGELCVPTQSADSDVIGLLSRWRGAS